MSTEVLVILDKVRSQLKKRGTKTIAGLGRTFRQFDSYNGDRKIDKEEFAVGLWEIGIELNWDESNKLLSFFDKDGDGNVDFTEFLIGVWGVLNDKRQAIVDKAFLKFDWDGSGQIEKNDLYSVYDVTMHPKFQNGTMTRDQILNEFLSNFGDANHDGIISRQEWNEYYSAISSNIDNDDHFVLLMRNAWKLD